jgi:hypothetical protein
MIETINLLTNLLYSLVKMGKIKYASEINDILSDFIEEDEQLNDDVYNMMANVVGIREDGNIENMGFGISLEPFFNTYTNLE